MSKVDWSTAPEDAQFYSFGAFRKQIDGKEYVLYAGQWMGARFDDTPVHKDQDDFEVRPEPAATDEPTPEEEEAFEIMSRNGESIGDFEFNNGDKVLVYRKCEWVEGQYVGSLNNVHNEHVCYIRGAGALVFRAKDIKTPESDRDKFISEALYIFDEKFPGTPFPDEATGLIGMVHDAMVRGDLPVPKVGK